MKKLLIAFAAMAALLTFPAHAQTVYGGIGLPGIYNLGYAHSINKSFGIRVQHSAGLNYNWEGTAEGVDVTANLKASSTGVYADWRPFEGGFRVVGGVSMNDIQAKLNARGTGNATINGQIVDMTGETYNTNLKFSDTTPYLGIGYGHQAESKGLGFYVDFGLMFGKFDVKSNTSLVTSGKATQADIDAQDAKARDGVAGVNVLPVIQLGVNYQF